MNSETTQILREGQKNFITEPPDYRAAKDLFQRVVQKQPNWIEGHHWLASAHEALNQTEDAESAYRSAMSCDREDPRPQVALGRLLMNAGRSREAIGELEAALKLSHHYAEADARLLLAEAYETAGERSKSRAEWTRI
jgi:Tfp pilus assembly protein PilF